MGDQPGRVGHRRGHGTPADGPRRLEQLHCQAEAGHIGARRYCRPDDQRGYIDVTATLTTLAVNVPCNTVARLCLLRLQMDTVRRGGGAASTALALDDVVVDSIVGGGHMCTRAPIGCGANGDPRIIRASKQAHRPQL